MTAFSEFYDPIRALLDDTDADIVMYENSQIDKAMKTALSLGKVTTSTATYRAVGTEVTPDLTVESDAKAYALLILHSAKVFCIGKRSLSWRTRAFSETVGDAKFLIADILDEIQKLESGGMSGVLEL